MDNCTIISVVNQKGGVAKSTSAISLGAALVKMGKKVYFVTSIRKVL